jgi:hypothetical protein
MMGGPGIGGQPPMSGFPDRGSFVGITGGHGMQGNGIPGGGWPGAGITGGGVIGREPPLGGFQGNGLGGGMSGVHGGGIVGINGPNGQQPFQPPQYPDLRGLPGQNKDDRQDNGAIHIPHIHIPEVNSFRPEPSYKATEPLTSFRSFESPHGTGGGFGKWFVGGLAGVGAAIAGAFRGKSGSKPADKISTHADLSGGLPLGESGEGGVWVRK